MRSLVAIVLIVTQVAGPWLCCCGPVRAFASVPAAAPVEAPADHCPLCAKTRPAGEATEAAAPVQHAPTLPGRCPCCATKVVDAIAAEPARDLDAATAALGFAPPVLAVLCPTTETPAPSINALPGTTNLPFMSTETRLFAHHALRC